MHATTDSQNKSGYTTALTALRPLLSTRTWNLLDRNGYTAIDGVRYAQAIGVLKDIHGMGPAALLEIRLALDELPQTEKRVPRSQPDRDGRDTLPEKPERERTAKEWPWLSPQELEIILELAEAGMTVFPQDIPEIMDQAHAALKRLREIAPKPPSALEPPKPEEFTFSPSLPYISQKEYETKMAAAKRWEGRDDDFAGYELDKPNGLDTWDF